MAMRAVLYTVESDFSCSRPPCSSAERGENHMRRHETGAIQGLRVGTGLTVCPPNFLVSIKDASFFFPLLTVCIERIPGRRQI